MPGARTGRPLDSMTMFTNMVTAVSLTESESYIHATQPTGRH